MIRDDVLPGAGGTGARLWAALTAVYELNPAERVLLDRACSALDRADVLELEVLDHGLVDAETGRATGAAVELRLVGLEAARLLRYLQIPDDEEAGARPGLRSVPGGRQ